mgnify:CR=1 FL=1
MKIQKTLIVFISLIFLIILKSNSQYRDSLEIQQEIINQSQKFKSLLETIYKNYADSVDIVKISEVAFNALLKGLDQYSLYYNSEQYKLLSEANKGSSEGIGVSIVSINDTCVVFSVVKGSPADSAGIRIGDKILFIDGKNIVKMSTTDIFKILNGQKASFVSIIIKRGFSNILQEFNLSRGDVHINSINCYFILEGTDIGYIKCNRFSSIADSEFVVTADALIKQGMKKLIIDLRNNPGGYLDQVTNIVDKFLDCKDVIAYTKSRNPEFEYKYMSNGNGKYKSIPLIILINSQSLSGSETIAGAIQDFDRGLIIGETSFGKALTQKLWTFNDGSAFQLTVGKYYTPSGRCIHKPTVSENEKSKLDPAIYLHLSPEEQKNIEKLIQSGKLSDKIQIFRTKKGRAVFSSGGIVPDYFVAEDTTTLLTRLLQTKGVFLEYALLYIEPRRKDLEQKYLENIDLFLKEFKVDDKMLNEFVALAKSKNIWNEAMFEKDANYIRNFIKAAIAHLFWENQGFYQVLYHLDNVINKAIELMPVAEKMIVK